MKRSLSIAIIAAVYAVAAWAGFLVFGWASAAMAELWALLLADVVATVITWFFGLVFRNVSVYDPYWSVAPPVMFTAWAVYKGCFTLPVVLLLIAVWYWGIRLTGNWAYTFKGLDHEDWRYTRYRETQSPLVFHLINFFGLNMMPTLLVFACCYVDEPIRYVLMQRHLFSGKWIRPVTPEGIAALEGWSLKKRSE